MINYDNYPEIDRLKDEVEQWKTQTKFWQDRHSNFLRQVKKISEDMDRLKAENDALIFVNRELGRINDELNAELLSSNHRSRSTISMDEVISSDETRPSKKIRQKSKTKQPTEALDDDDAARVRLLKYFYNNTYIII